MDLKGLNEFIVKVYSVADAVTTVQHNIQKRRGSFLNNERQTRSVLIDPILRCLGWDVSQVDLVGSEYRTRSSGTADYALFGRTDPIALIEAKCLESPFDVGAAEQLGRYTSDERTVRFAIFTNGDHWRMRETNKKETAIDIRLSKGHPLKSALELMRLWRLVMDAEPDSNLAVNEKVSQSQTGINDGSGPTTQGNWVKLTALNDPKGMKSPCEIRFPNDEVREIPSWRQMWIKVAEWVAKCRPEMTACKFGHRKHMVLKSADEGFWRKGFQLSNGLWIEPGLSAKNVVRTATVLLEYYEIDPSTVLVRLDDRK